MMTVNDTHVMSDDEVSLTHRTGEDEAERIRDPAVPMGQFVAVNYKRARDLRKTNWCFGYRAQMKAER